MIQITPQMRILVSIAPQDFRKGIDDLSLDAKVDFAFARETLGPKYLRMGNVELSS